MKVLTKATHLADKIHSSNGRIEEWIKTFSSRADAQYQHNGGCDVTVLNFSDDSSLLLCIHGAKAICYSHDEPEVRQNGSDGNQQPPPRYSQPRDDSTRHHKARRGTKSKEHYTCVGSSSDTCGVVHRSYATAQDCVQRHHFSSVKRYQRASDRRIYWCDKWGGHQKPATKCHQCGDILIGAFEMYCSCRYKGR